MQFVWTQLKHLYQSLLRQCRSAVPVLLGLAVGLVLVGIWWLGPHWVWHEHRPLAELPMRMLATVLVLLVPLLFWTWSLRHRYGRLHAEHEHVAALAADPCLPYVEAQERVLNRNLVNFLQHVGGRRSLYALPWYLVLGEERAGKTSLINRSGQKFALNHATRAVRTSTDERLAYPCDWWIGDEALLIESPGQFVAAGAANGRVDAASDAASGSNHAPGAMPVGNEHRLWTHLLEWLSLHRSRRALNGVLVVIDIAGLLQKPDPYPQQLAQQLRNRLYELSRQLGTRLPVYVVLGKLDLLAGFEELFEHLPVDQREAVTGFGFTLDALLDHDVWLEECGQQLDRFVACLSEQAMTLLARVQTPESRKQLYSLLMTLAGMRPLVRRFLDEMLGSDRFGAPALVRGVYLASVEQSGSAYNAFVTAVARSHGLGPAPATSRQADARHVYFAQKLFQTAIYPEAGLAGDNFKVACRKRRLLLGGSIVAGLGVLLAVGGWQHYFALNRDQAVTVLVRSQDFSADEIATQIDSTGRNLLAPLDQIRSTLAVYADYRDTWPGLRDFGLYQGRAIGPRVDEAYLSLLSRRFLPAIAEGAIARMNAAAAGSDEQLAALRVYRMIEDPGNRQPQLVREWMARQWQTAYPGQGLVQEALLGHLDYALKYADADMPQHGERVTEVQQHLRQAPLAQRVYLGLKENARGQLHNDLDLRNEVGPAFDIVYRNHAAEHPSSGFAVPALLTAEGHRSYFSPRSEDLAQLAIIDQWVLGERRQISYSEEDRKALAARLRALYSADYIDSWRRALNQLVVTDFNDLGHAVAVLGEVTGPSAPLRRLLEAVSDNSALRPLPAVLAAHASPSLTAMHEEGRQSESAIRREFAALARLLEEKNDRPTFYEEMLAQISALRDYSKAVLDHPESGKAALAAVLARFSLNAPDPISALQRLATGLPEPLDLQIGKLADQTARVLMVEALRELERRWETDIYHFYQQRLAHRYPFSASGNDASLQDFEAFFAPNGRLQRFQDQYLNVFVRDNLDALKDARTGRYLVRTDVLEQLNSAERIRETFFTHQGGLGVQFSLEPLGLSGNKRSSMLALDGQLIPYSHGPSKRIGLIWPNTLTAGPGSKLALVHAAGNTSSRGFTGPWSLFRLLSSGQLYGHTETSVDLSFRIAGGVMRYRITAEKSANPFTERPFKGFMMPKTLLDRAAPVVAGDKGQAL